MNNALLYLGGILITALAVLFAVPRFVDWNSYRGVFEEEATRILGREVRVGGDVNLRLLPAPFVSFEKLRIADVGDDGGNSIIRAESFTMWLSVPPLLRGVLEAHKVELRRPVINLAINDEGGGNWRSLAVTPGTLPFAPKEVALQSVAIQDGAVIVTGPSRDELARFDDINGEFNAEAIEGPYKFKGNVNWNDVPRHVRIATAKLDGNGDLRFKAAVDVADSTNSYVLDGKLSDLKGSPALEGDLTAKLNFGATARAAASESRDITLAPEPSPASPPATTPNGDGELSVPGVVPGAVPAPPAPAPDPATAASAKGFELKSKVRGTALGVELKDVNVSLEAGATPQLITGQATFGWASKTQLDVSLASRWLDLDQLARTGQSGMPFEAARGYFEALAAALPAAADTNALLEFDQLTLGGEPVSNVRFAASRSGGPLELKGVRADLPGGVRLDLDGVLTPAAGKVPDLDGTLFISGKSLMRFLAWGLGKPEIGRERGDGSFSLDGHFALGNGTLALTDATVDISGTPIEGELKLELGEHRKVAVAIEGQRIDAAQFSSGLVDLANLRQVLFGADGPTGAPEPERVDGAASFDPASGDLALDLKVAELVDGDRVLKDVDADIRLERGKLSIPRLRFATAEGLYVDAEGEAMDVPANPKGSVRGLVSAPNAAAARALVSLLGADDGSRAQLDRIAGLAPFRLAGTLELAGGAANANTLRVDGTLGGGRMAASLRLDGGRTQWRTSPLDLQATIDSPDVAHLLTTLFETDLKSRGAASPAKSGRVVIKAAGIPSEGLLSFADATADGLTIGYRGRVRLAKPREPEHDGELRIATADARVAFSLAGLSVADEASNIPLSGTVGIRRDGPALKLESEALALGGSTLSGQVTLTAADGGRGTIDATLAADKASFATLLAPLLSSSEPSDVLAAIVPPQPQPAPPPRSAPEPDAAPPIWPDRSFDLTLLDRLDGKIVLTVGSLALEPDLTLANARLAAELSREGVKVQSLEGDAVGGRLRSQFDITKAPAGIGLAGKLRIDVFSNKPDTGDDGKPGDTAAFGVTFSSRALSPAAIMAAMTGSGELTVGDATLNGNSPAAVAAVVRAALAGQGPTGGAPFAEAIGGALKQGEVKLGKITIPVEISDGALKLKKVQIDMAEGRSTFVTVVELATMKIDSEWQIEPKLGTEVAATATRTLLPPVTVVYTGKLSAFASLAPRVSAGALERELMVRKMEIDVGELERLRKLDEARALEDSERRKAEEERARLEAERRKAAEEDNLAPPQAGAPETAPDAVQREPLPAPPGGNTPGVYDNSVVDAPEGVPVEQDIEAAAPPPAVAPSPTAQRPKRKRPVEQGWQPFNQLSPF